MPPADCARELVQSAGLMLCCQMGGIRMRNYIYADESGNFYFSDDTKASRYFILTTVAVSEHTAETDLMDLRRELAWEGWPGVQLRNAFHAADDNRHVRNRVFNVLSRHEFRIDATILEKRKVNPELHSTDARFYGFAWRCHLRGLISMLNAPNSEHLIIASSIGNNRMRRAFDLEISQISRLVTHSSTIKSDMWSANTNPLLQVADYCSWAVQRKWEHGDSMPYSFIGNNLNSQYDIFQNSAIVYY